MGKTLLSLFYCIWLLTFLSGCAAVSPASASQQIDITTVARGLEQIASGQPVGATWLGPYGIVTIAFKQNGQWIVTCFTKEGFCNATMLKVFANARIASNFSGFVRQLEENGFKVTAWEMLPLNVTNTISSFVKGVFRAGGAAAEKGMFFIVIPADGEYIPSEYKVEPPSIQ